jgi:hypothetical protein
VAFLGSDGAMVQSFHARGGVAAIGHAHGQDHGCAARRRHQCPSRRRIRHDSVGNGPSNHRRHTVAKGWPPDVRRLCATHDVLVFPSVEEAFGLVCVEALSASLPSSRCVAQVPGTLCLPARTAFLWMLAIPSPSLTPCASSPTVQRWLLDRHQALSRWDASGPGAVPGRRHLGNQRLGKACA